MRISLIPKLLALSLVSIGPLAHGQAAGPLGIDESDSVLLQPLLGRVPLADSINAFPVTDGALVPFGEICRLLAFGILVDAAEGRAEGYFISEKRRFHLDLASRSVAVEGQKFTFTATEVIRVGQELFVDARLLEVWFPLEVKVNLRTSAVLLKPKEKLPIQEQWEREGKYTSGVPSLSSQGSDDHPVGEYLKTPYSFADMPFADLSAYWSKSRGGASGQPAISAFLGGDLLWMSAVLSASRDQNGKVANPSWTLFREDPHGELLGPMHAKRVEFGNIQQPPSLGVAGSLPQGRGLLLDNYPLSYRSKFATRSFTGILEDGWSVELYQNSGLVGFQKARADGQYEFREVPLRFGLNQFKLVFHGPFGQTRTETSRLDIASDQPAPGEFFYRMTGVRPLKSTGISDQLDPAAVAETEKKTASLAQMEYGLSKVFAVKAGAARVTHLDGLLHSYNDVGLRAVFPYASIQVDAAQDRTAGGTSGTAREVAISSGYNYSTFTLQRTDYQNGFEPLDALDTSTLTKAISSETLAQWDGTLEWRQQPIAISLSRNSKNYVDGGWTTTDAVRGTFTCASLTISPMLSRTTESDQAGSASINGVVFMTGSRGNYNIQSEVDCSRTDDGTKLTGWSLLADRTATNGFVYRFGIKGTDNAFKNVSLLAGLSKLTGRYGYGLDCQYSKSSGYAIGLRAQAAFGREPRTGKWISEAKPMAGQGAISAVAFMDANGNKKLDPNEQILQETQFKVGNQAVENAIKDPRVVFKGSMPRSQDTLVRVDESSLEDPSCQSVVKVYRIVPRPGKVARIDFPIAAFGEIDGTTCLRRAGGTAEFGGLQVELLTADGEPFRVVRSAYDGYFEIRDLPLGDYLLRISPADVSRLKLKESQARKYHIDGEKNLFEGQYLTVEPIAVPGATGEKVPTSLDPQPAPSQLPAENPPKPDAPISTPVSLRETPSDAPAPHSVQSSSLASRLRAIERGDLAEAIAISEAVREAQTPGTWTLCLETARELHTVRKAVTLFRNPNPDLWILPIRSAVGGDRYKVMLGFYSDRAAAELELRRLPEAFLAEGNHPKVITCKEL